MRGSLYLIVDEQAGFEVSHGDNLLPLGSWEI